MCHADDESAHIPDSKRMLQPGQVRNGDMGDMSNKKYPTDMPYRKTADMPYRKTASTDMPYWKTASTNNSMLLSPLPLPTNRNPCIALRSVF